MTTADLFLPLAAAVLQLAKLIQVVSTVIAVWICALQGVLNMLAEAALVKKQISMASYPVSVPHACFQPPD